MLMKIQHLLHIKMKLTADGTAADLGASAARWLYYLWWWFNIKLI